MRIDINYKTEKGLTPLHCACLEIDDGKNDDKTVVKLLSLGADVNSRDSTLKTPLHLAKTASKIYALIKEGADINAVDSILNTPLHDAVTIIPIEKQKNRNFNANWS